MAMTAPPDVSVFVYICLLALLATRGSVVVLNIIQLLPALKVNIIIVHPRGVVFPRALSRGKTTFQGLTIMMFTTSAGNNCFIIMKLYLQ